MLEKQLQERWILFSELWHLLKGYLAIKYTDWEALPAEQQEQLLLTTGTTFIMEQLPMHLQWLAGFVAKATILRSMRPKTVAALMKLLEKLAPEEARADLREHNSFVQYWGDLGHDIEFIDHLNNWQVRLNRHTWHWAIAASVACAQAGEDARFMFLKQSDSDSEGHRFFQVADDLEADDYQDGKLTLWHLDQDHWAWLDGGTSIH